MTSPNASPLSQQPLSPRAANRLAVPFLCLFVAMSLFLLTSFSSVETSVSQQHGVRALSSAFGPPFTKSSSEEPSHRVHDGASHPQQEAVNVLFSLSGNDTGFLAEFETGLKSVLLNAPLETDLNVHILADGKAHAVLPSIFNKTGLQGSLWRTQITIHTYNVDPFVKQWSKKIETLYKKPIKKVVRHTIASYFRLFVNDVLPETVEHVVYMDTDVVIMANLGNLWTHINPDATLIWGRDYCAGFVILNVKKAPQLWNVASKVDMKKFAKQLKHKLGDQLILKAVNWTRPEMVAFLPNEWAMSIANNRLWTHTKELLTYRPQVGMFHFNGGGISTDSYWKNAKAPIQRYPDKYGLAMYYVKMPWTWALFMGKSQITNGEGHGLVIHHGHDENRIDGTFAIM